MYITERILFQDVIQVSSWIAKIDIDEKFDYQEHTALELQICDTGNPFAAAQSICHLSFARVQHVGIVTVQ